MITREYIEWFANINFYEIPRRLDRLLITERVITNSIITSLQDPFFSSKSPLELDRIYLFYSDSMYFLLEAYLELLPIHKVRELTEYKIKIGKRKKPFLIVLIKGILLPYFIFDKEKLRQEILIYLEEYRPKLREFILK